LIQNRFPARSSLPDFGSKAWPNRPSPEVDALNQSPLCKSGAHTRKRDMWERSTDAGYPTGWNPYRNLLQYIVSQLLRKVSTSFYVFSSHKSACRRATDHDIGYCCHRGRAYILPGFLLRSTRRHRFPMRDSWCKAADTKNVKGILPKSAALQFDRKFLRRVAEELRLASGTNGQRVGEAVEKRI
jgi:hypothetical protein